MARGTEPPRDDPEACAGVRRRGAQAYTESRTTMKSVTAAFVLALTMLVPNLARAQDVVQLAPPELDVASPAHNMALGGGQSGVIIFNLAAHSGPLGEDARGHFRWKGIAGTIGEGVHLRGDVTCLTVVPNLVTGGGTATLGGIFTEFELPGLPPDAFHGFLWTVEDSGKGQLAPDTHSGIALLANPPMVCATAFPTIFPVDQGSIVVHGAIP
jgi:hypothetical protein